jgi:hypothetical protein
MPYESGLWAWALKNYDCYGGAELGAPTRFTPSSEARRGWAAKRVAGHKRVGRALKRSRKIRGSGLGGRIGKNEATIGGTDNMDARGSFSM